MSNASDENEGGRMGPRHEPAESEPVFDREALARRLADVLGGGGDGASSDREEPAPEGGTTPLKLDRTGALADRPKLEPKRPYARTGRDVPPPQPTPGDSVPADSASVIGSVVPHRATIPPPLGSVRPGGAHELATTVEPIEPPDEVSVPGGRFLYGEEREEREVPPFKIDRVPVTHARYAKFVEATGHRPPLYWPDGEVPRELADHPVVGVDYYDALAYARFKGRDLPYEDEWEYAARGTDGRVYPWGDEADLCEANTARLGLKMSLPVGWHDLNVSPDGVRDMVGNVWEITHSPAPGGGIVVRGGSWYDFALYAKSWFRFVSRPDARNGTIGFRCVLRAQPRSDAPREVDAASAEAEIAARQGPVPSADTSAYSAERRDLVPDLRHLRRLLAEREEEGAVKRDAALAQASPRASTVPVRATPPPPIKRGPLLPPDEDAVPAEEDRAAAKHVSPPPRREPEEIPAYHVSAMPESKPIEQRFEHRVTVPPAPARPRESLASKAASWAPKGLRLPTSSPKVFWAFMGTGAVLVGTLLVLLITGVLGGNDAPQMPHAQARVLPPVAPGSERSGEAPASPASAPDYGLPPAPPAGPTDHEPVEWIDGTMKPLERGAWLAVLVESNDAASRTTVRAANVVHRRMRSVPARLAIVLPRALFQDEGGNLLGEAERNERLRGLGASADVTVYLNGRDGATGGVDLRSHFRLRQPIVAVVLSDGRLESRMAAFEGGFSEEDLLPLARAALEAR